MLCDFKILKFKQQQSVEHTKSVLKKHKKTKKNINKPHKRRKRKVEVK
jgi:hypothetical protein